MNNIPSEIQLINNYLLTTYFQQIIKVAGILATRPYP